jgi:hypothetical protein
VSKDKAKKIVVLVVAVACVVFLVLKGEERRPEECAVRPCLTFLAADGSNVVTLHANKAITDDTVRFVAEWISPKDNQQVVGARLLPDDGFPDVQKYFETVVLETSDGLEVTWTRTYFRNNEGVLLAYDVVR